MKFYEAKGGRLKCLLCQHYCQLQLNQIGICGVIQNMGESLECLVYGYPAAINVDPIEKKPIYHILPHTSSLSLGTVGCNFRCNFCQNWGISQSRKIDKSRYLAPDTIVSMAKLYDCSSISYTYNEPTIFYPYVKDIALLAHKEGLINIMVSNGFMSDEVLEDMVGVIDVVNIDLKSFNKEYYTKSLGGNLEKVLKNLIRLKKSGIHIEVTTLLVPQRNDSDDEILSIASFIKNSLGEDTVWHISAFHPDYKELELPRTSYESLKSAYDIGKELGLKHIYVGNCIKFSGDKREH